MMTNQTGTTIGEFLESNNMTMKELASSNHLSIAELYDLMNRDYDRNDPRFLQEFQLSVYKHVKEKGMARIEPKIKDNMITKPETIGLSKDNHYLDGMEQGINALDIAYNNEASLENTQTRTK